MDLMDTYKRILFADSKLDDDKRENANVNANEPMGIMLKIGAESCKYYVDNYVLPKEIREADKENYVHINDKDFSLITLNCVQIDLLKLFHGGFSTGHGYIREPQSIRSYATLLCIAIQSVQNSQLGGVSIQNFDYTMAEGIRKSFKNDIKYEIAAAADYLNKEFDKEDIDYNLITYEDYHGSIKELTRITGDNDLSNRIYIRTCILLEKETHQAMESLVHNLCTL